LEPQPYPAHGCSELTPAAWLSGRFSGLRPADGGLVRTGTADL